MAEMVHNCIQGGDIDNRLPLYANIVLRWGGAWRPGCRGGLGTADGPHRRRAPAVRPTCPPASHRRRVCRCPRSGGSTMFPGIASRLDKELRRLYLDRCAAAAGSLALPCLALPALPLPRPHRAPAAPQRALLHTRHSPPRARPARRPHRVLKGEREGLRRLKLRVEDPPRRRHMVFTGAAVLADIMRGQPEFWISRQEWAEDPHRALAKCGGLGAGGA